MIRFLVNLLVLVISLGILAATAGWVYLERQWAAWEPPTGADAEIAYEAFTFGPFGLEAMPLKYAAVVGQVSGPAFTTGLEDGRTPWQTFGFLDNPRAGENGQPLCEANALQKLPYGFAVTNSIPETALQTPLKFAALTCATCHSGAFRAEDGTLSGIVSGMGNQELDVIAFSDAVRNAVTDPTLTADKILEAYDAQCGEIDPAPDFLTAQIEKLMLGQWLSGIRGSIGGDFAKYGMPYHGAGMKSASDIPAGPGRTRPFRSVVRVAVNLPGVENYAYSKVPVVFEQRTDLRPRSQYDGSIKSPVTRSYIAAYTSGSSLVALGKPQVNHAIRHAARYTEELGISIPVASFRDIFPDRAPNLQQVQRGFEVYQQYCTECHGYRDLESGEWVAEGAYLHEYESLDPAGNRLGVDDKRVTFRYAKKLPLPLWTALPGPSLVADEQAARLAQAQQDAESPAFAYFWQQMGEAFERNRRIFRNGHPLYFPECAPDDPECTPESLLAEAPFCSDAPDAAETCAITAEVAMFNNPIPRAFMRAPYLHNGSIPNMRQLINLDPRPVRFCRGENVYDPDAMGYVAPDVPAGGSCDNPRMPFLYDTALPGNSAAGHDFPWPYEELDDARRQDLEALMAYLKTL
ncbi:MAG: hypothetical protein AAFP68_08260 [Pseudomonadota bacterium]